MTPVKPSHRKEDNAGTDNQKRQDKEQVNDKLRKKGDDAAGQDRDNASRHFTLSEPFDRSALFHGFDRILHVLLRLLAQHRDARQFHGDLAGTRAQRQHVDKDVLHRIHTTDLIERLELALVGQRVEQFVNKLFPLVLRDAGQPLIDDLIDPGTARVVFRNGRKLSMVHAPAVHGVLHHSAERRFDNAGILDLDREQFADDRVLRSDAGRAILDPIQLGELCYLRAKTGAVKIIDVLHLLPGLIVDHAGRVERKIAAFGLAAENVLFARILCDDLLRILDGPVLRARVREGDHEVLLPARDRMVRAAETNEIQAGHFERHGRKLQGHVIVEFIDIVAADDLAETLRGSCQTLQLDLTVIRSDRANVVLQSGCIDPVRDLPHAQTRFRIHLFDLLRRLIRRSYIFHVRRSDARNLVDRLHIQIADLADYQRIDLIHGLLRKIELAHPTHIIN